MKKLTQRKDFIGYILVAVFVIGGIGIPYLLLEIQENQLVSRAGEYDLISTSLTRSTSDLQSAGEENDSGTIIEANSQFDPELDANELYARLYDWDNGSNLTTREPDSNELSIETAIQTAREQAQELVANDALPQMGISSYIFDYAVLTSKEGPISPKSMTAVQDGIIGRWEITFLNKSNESKLTLIIDASSGVTLGYSLSTNESLELHFHEMLVGFAQYNGLFRSDLTFASKHNYNVLDIGGFRISYDDSSSADQVKFAISIVSQS